MRMMMKVSIPAAAGNRALKDESLQKTMMAFVETHRPEGAWFVSELGGRCAYFVFDLPETAAIPAVAEPFFTALDAQLQLTPAMNVEDLRTGVERAMKKR